MDRLPFDVTFLWRGGNRSRGESHLVAGSIAVCVMPGRRALGWIIESSTVVATLGADLRSAEMVGNRTKDLLEGETNCALRPVLCMGQRSWGMMVRN